MRFKTKMIKSSLFLSAACIAMPAFAQDTTANQSEDEDEDVSISSAASDDTSGSIVVTGSRIRQDTFNSPTPIQVLDAEEAFKIGVTSATELLQRATVASGQQIDATINTNSGNSNATEAPPDGGSGSSNIDLRGLGTQRTLVMVNGRRLGVAGVRGAPSQPDISLIPFGMIERVDVVTEGASSIYGADAVAGVVNVILKNDFEGMEVSGSIQRSEHGGGDVEQFSAILGTSGDRARIMVGAEYYNRSSVNGNQRSFTRGGIRSIEETEDGEILSVFATPFLENTTLTSGDLITDEGRVVFAGLALIDPRVPGNIIGQDGNVVPGFYTGASIPLPDNARDFCTLNSPPGGGTDFCGLNFRYDPFYSDAGDRRKADIVQPLERWSFYANGSYDLFDSNDIRLYFEASYSERRQSIRAAPEQIAPTILAEIPQLDENGLAVGLVDNPLNPFDIDLPIIITLDDIPQTFEVNVTQQRLVGGIDGSIPGEFFEERDWRFDAGWSWDRGVGFQGQRIIFEPALYNVTEGLYLDADGNLGCTPIERGDELDQLTLPDCPVVDFLAPTFYIGGPTGDGAFENDAQRDYLLGNRTNRTEIEQTVYYAFINGGLFDIPWGGEVKFAAGYEHRDDEITSLNSLVGVQGLNSAENPLTEGETVGARNLDEIYAEIQIPLIEDKPFVDLFQIDAAIRYTDESNFGAEETYRLRGLWRPVDWIQISGSYGTSYRAPNLREQFLADQGGGVSGTADPCRNAPIQLAIGAATQDGGQGDADPDVQRLITRCAASGVVFTDSDNNGFLDTTQFGTGVISTIPVTTGGNADLLPETSESYTATFSINPPISSAFDIDLAVSYYDFTIENAVQNLGGDTIISRCYFNLEFEGLGSPFCDLFGRQTNVPATNTTITTVRAGFVNTGEETAKGIDINARFRTNFEDLFGGPDVDFFVAASATHVMEREVRLFVEDDPLDLAGTPGFPEWKWQATGGLSFGKLEILTQLNWQQGQAVAEEFQDTFNLNGVYVDDAGNRVTSRALRSFGSQVIQDLSVSFDFSDDVAITAGIQNLWDKEPPLVDRVGVPNRLNAVSSSGFDFIGRTFFLNTRFKI